jgi:sporadic carbohydrate cluster protein (TIGR04323 family)
MSRAANTDARGYIWSRPFLGERAPQHVQNLVVRDYCAKQGFTYLLSATEYAMPESFNMLEQVIAEAPSLKAVVAYSMFMLPPDAARRRDAYRRILDAGASFHGALEQFAIASDDGIRRAEDIWMVRAAMASALPAAELRAR